MAHVDEPKKWVGISGNSATDNAVLCPICRDGRLLGQTGESNGHMVRGWMDDDEFLIRGRIHRDLSAVLREQGIT